MKTKLLLAVSTALVCAALAVFVSGNVSDNSASSFEVENVEALSIDEYDAGGTVLIKDYENRTDRPGCLGANAICQIDLNNGTGRRIFADIISFVIDVWRLLH